MIQGFIEKQICKILNDVNLNDQDKILSIINYPPSAHTYPTGFVTILNIIKEENSNFVDEHQKIILNFLKIYSSNSIDLDLKRSLFKDKFSEILLNLFNKDSKSLSDKFLTLISTPISQTIVWSDFDHKISNSDSDPETSLRKSYRYSSKNSIYSSSSPLPLETSSDLKILGESNLQFPVPIGDNSNENIVSISGIAVTSSEEVFQTSSKMIGDQQNQQEDLFPWPKRLSEGSVYQEVVSVHQGLFQLPKRLDLNNSQLPHQNIASSISASIQLNQLLESNLAITNNSELTIQNSFLLPQKLRSLGYSDVAPIEKNDIPVVQLKSNTSENKSLLADIPLTLNNDERKLQNKDPQDEPEKNPSCCVFLRAPFRLQGLNFFRRNCSFLNHTFANCLQSSRSKQVEPVK